MSLLTVIIPTHNPDRVRFARTLAGLCAQTLPAGEWETVIVDNASATPVDLIGLASVPMAARVIREPKPGLTFARMAGLKAARGEIVVLVDDDNVLAPDYLEQCLAIFRRFPHLGAAGGKSIPEFAVTPLAWQSEFFGLLALRDLGDQELIADSLRPPGTNQNQYPAFAPIGAGMSLRREAALIWVDAITSNALPRTTDRTGRDLTSGGDNDIILTLLGAGWASGYFPQLRLSHLIPPERLEPDYLSRLNRGIQKSWMQVLARHDANPWPPLSPLGADLRKAKAWFKSRAWSSAAADIRWQGACGHFDGRAQPSPSRISTS